MEVALTSPSTVLFTVHVDGAKNFMGLNSGNDFEQGPFQWIFYPPLNLFVYFLFKFWPGASRKWNCALIMIIISVGSWQQWTEMDTSTALLPTLWQRTSRVLLWEGLDWSVLPLPFGLLMQNSHAVFHTELT